MPRQWKDKDTIIETQTVERVIDIKALQDSADYHRAELAKVEAEIADALNVPNRPNT